VINRLVGAETMPRPQTFPLTPNNSLQRASWPHPNSIPLVIPVSSQCYLLKLFEWAHEWPKFTAFSSERFDANGVCRLTGETVSRVWRLQPDKCPGDKFGSLTIFRIISQKIGFDDGVCGILPGVTVNDRIEANRRLLGPSEAQPRGNIF